MCESSDGCATLGECVALPVGQICGAAITPYCDCDGVTQQSTNTCINDRFESLGACD